MVSYPITHLQTRVSHFEQVSRFFLPSPTFISCSSCPTCSTCQLTCRFSAPRSTTTGATPTTARSMRCVAHAQSSATELIFATSDSAPACECPSPRPHPRQVVARDTSDLDGFQMMARPRTSNGGQACRKGPSNLSCDPTLSSLPDQLLRRHGIKPTCSRLHL